MKRIGIATLAVVALASAPSAVVPQTASALCRRAIPNEPSNWADRTSGVFLWTCYSRQGAGGTGGFSKIAEERNEGRRVGTSYCYHVESGSEASLWPTNRCTGTAMAATGGYFLSTERPWFAFRENSAKGKPVDKVAASGGEQLFKTTAGTIACKALSLTEGEEPSETESAGLGLSVQFEECEAFGLPATVDPVELEFSAEGDMSLATDLKVLATNCTVTFPASENTTLEAVKYSNVSGQVEIEPNVTGLTSEGAGSACSYSRESKGTYSGKSLVGWASGGTLEWLDTEKEHLEIEEKEKEEEAAGPHYLLSSGLLNLGEDAKLEALSSGKFTLKPALSSPAVLCEHVSAPTLLLGGAPGKSDTEVDLSGCTADNTAETTHFPLCDVHNAGKTGNLILVKAEDELVYTGSESEAKKGEGPLGDLFTPEGGGTTFVTLEFEALSGGTGCPSGTPSSLAVTGSVVGEVEPVNTMVTEGMLTFPKSAIKKAYRWTGSGKVSEVATGLKLPTGAATQIGLADLKLTSGESWGTLTT